MQRNGFTLLETIIAVTVVMVGVVGLMTLGVFTIQTERQTTNATQAQQLAQEGVEVVRAIRDSNWLERANGASVAWNRGLESSGDYTAILNIDQYVAGAVTTTLDFTPDDFSDSDATRVWYNTAAASGRLTQRVSPVPSFEATPYSRLITLHPICRAGDNSETIPGTACSGATQVGIRVQVAVQWDENGSTQEYIEEAHLYDWQQ